MKKKVTLTILFSVAAVLFNSVNLHATTTNIKSNEDLQYETESEEPNETNQPSDGTEGVKSMFVISKDGVFIRLQPSVNSNALDTKEYGDMVQVITKVNESNLKSLGITQYDEDKTWAVIPYKEIKAYVCMDYLDNEKPVTANDYDYIDDLGTFRLTAYEWTGDPCFNGNYPTRGYTVASNELPMGTKLFIEGYGEFTVEDTGRFPYGTIDIYLGDPDECWEFGVQYGHVYVLSYPN